MGSMQTFVFVKQGTSWVPRRVRVGASDFDYSEVLSGLNEGDVVALLGTVVQQGQRDQAANRARNMTSTGLPGTGSTSSSSSARPAAGGGGGGGR